TPESRVLHFTAFPGELRLTLLLLELGEARAEDPERGLPVRKLRALVLALDDDPGRQVGDPHSGIRLVHVLPAGARRAIRVDADLRVVDLELSGIVDEGADDHLRKGRVAAVGLVER